MTFPWSLQICSPLAQFHHQSPISQQNFPSNWLQHHRQKRFGLAIWKKMEGPKTSTWRTSKRVGWLKQPTHYRKTSQFWWPVWITSGENYHHHEVKIIYSWWLNPFRINMRRVKLDHFCRDPGEHLKNIWKKPPPSDKFASFQTATSTDPWYFLVNSKKGKKKTWEKIAMKPPQFVWISGFFIAMQRIGPFGRHIISL